MRAAADRLRSWDANLAGSAAAAEAAAEPGTNSDIRLLRGGKASVFDSSDKIEKILSFGCRTKLLLAYG